MVVRSYTPLRYEEDECFDYIMSFNLFCEKSWKLLNISFCVYLFMLYWLWVMTTELVFLECKLFTALLPGVITQWFHDICVSFTCFAIVQVCVVLGFVKEAYRFSIDVFLRFLFVGILGFRALISIMLKLQGFLAEGSEHLYVILKDHWVIGIPESIH